MSFWRKKGRASPEPPPEAAPEPGQPVMGPATARAVLERFQVALSRPAALIGHEHLDVRLLVDAPDRIAAAIIVVACEEVRGNRVGAVAPLREAMRRLGATVSAEEADRLRAFHAKLPGGAEATLTGITARIEEAIAGVDFVALSTRQGAEVRRLLARFDAGVAAARRTVPPGSEG